ncbi:MAG: N-acetylmuramoyl-L-alanine amidase [bacterium]
MNDKQFTDMIKPGERLEPHTVFISAGHYPQKPGAINKGLRLKEHFEAQKVAVCFSKLEERSNYKFQLIQPDTLYKKVELISSQKVKDSKLYGAIAIEIHFNSCPNPNTGQGIETLYYQESQEGKVLAHCIQRELLGVLPFVDRGIKGRDDLYFLNATPAPAVIVEALFLNNDREARYLFYPRAHLLIAQAISDGIQGFYGLFDHNQALEKINVSTSGRG